MEEQGAEVAAAGLAMPVQMAPPSMGGGDTQSTCVLKLKGLPFSATEKDLHEFFGGFAVVKAAVHMGHDGRPSGLGFAEFATPEEAGRAMQRDKAFIGPRFVKLLRVPKSEMDEQLAGGGYGGGGPPGGARGPWGGGFRQPDRGPRPPMPGAPMGFAMFPGQYGMPYNPMVGGMHDDRARMGAMPGYNPRLPAMAGQTVKMRGLPFRVTMQEIVSFFEGFDVIPDTINFGWDRMGRPSGEAWISFRTAEEAERAANNLNKQYIGNRYIELVLM